MTWPDVPGLLFGGDYNPEQWPPQTWAEDIRLMRQARINLVTLGVFSWSVLEPRDGEFDFDWMESLLDDLHQARISVDLATATASPPPWLTSEHPDVLPVDRTGTVRWPGGRQAFCPHADDYRQRAVRIAGRLAERFGTHPAVVMWHVNNEYGCHTPACYCDHSAQAFREWLAQRYASLDALNDAWGTAVWSMRYADWTQIQPPRATPDGTAPQPGLVLDFHRFSSDSLLALFTAEKAAIREHDAVHPVTTNFMSMSHIYEMDYWTWAQHVDFVATDHYTIAASTKRHIDLAFQADRTRGWAGGRPWMLMEHAAGAVNWQPRNRTTSPGEMLRDAVSYLAHGADATLYFQFRAATAGSERFHSALLPHAGPNTERWRETVALGETIERLAELKGSVLHNQIAIVWDNESAWALRQPNLPTLDLDLEALAFEWYRELWRHGHGVDFVSPDHELEGYRVVLVPLAYLFRPELGERLDECAHDGTRVLVSYFSGISDRHDRVIDGDAVGGLTDLLGVRVEEFAPLLKGEEITLSNGWTADRWSEVSATMGAEAVATFPGDRGVAVARHSVGSGVVWYAGTHLRDWEPLLAAILGDAGLAWANAGGLDVQKRTSTLGNWLLAVNHGEATASLTVHGVDLVTGLEGTHFDLDPGGVAVIRQTGP